MAAATGIETEKAVAHARQAALLHELNQNGLIQDPSLIEKLNSTSLLNILSDAFDKNQDQRDTKRALVRAALDVASARGEDSGLSYSAKHRDSALVGSFVKLAEVSGDDVAKSEAYLRGVLESRKSANHDKAEREQTPPRSATDSPAGGEQAGTRFRDLVSSPGRGRELS